LGRAARQAIRSLATKDGIVLFDALVEQFMRTEPYSKAQRVFVIVDNGSAHRGGEHRECQRQHDCAATPWQRASDVERNDPTEPARLRRTLR